MIEIHHKNGLIERYETIHELGVLSDEVLNIRFIGSDNLNLNEVSDKFDIDLAFFSKKEDIEISSHYFESVDQLSLHFAIPSYSPDNSFEEKDIYIVIKKNIVFTFLSKETKDGFNQFIQIRYGNGNAKFESHKEFFMFQIGLMSDYFADNVELISKKIITLFQRTLKLQQFKDSDLDYITELKFNNLLIGESLSEFQRVLYLLKRNDKDGSFSKLNLEIEDLTVVADYLQNNFNRLDDLRANVNSKIDLEQNRIFKILTIITVCVSLPTLIAGIYGMNFIHMPELDWAFGYPVVILLMLCAFVIPLIYFRKKKWF